MVQMDAPVQPVLEGWGYAASNRPQEGAHNDPGLPGSGPVPLTLHMRQRDWCSPLLSHSPSSPSSWLCAPAPSAGAPLHHLCCLKLFHQLLGLGPFFLAHDGLQRLEIMVQGLLEAGAQGAWEEVLVCLTKATGNLHQGGLEEAQGLHLQAAEHPAHSLTSSGRPGAPKAEVLSTYVPIPGVRDSLLGGACPGFPALSCRCLASWGLERQVGMGRVGRGHSS